MMILNFNIEGLKCYSGLKSNGNISFILSFPYVLIVLTLPLHLSFATPYEESLSESGSGSVTKLL